MSYCINDVKVKETGVGNWVLREPWRGLQICITCRSLSPRPSHPVLRIGVGERVWDLRIHLQQLS